MRPYMPGLAISAISISLLTALPAAATPFFFSTGNPDGKIATATRPDAGGKFEIESADDFVLTGSYQHHQRHIYRDPHGGAPSAMWARWWSRSIGYSRGFGCGSDERTARFFDPTFRRE